MSELLKRLDVRLENEVDPIEHGALEAQRGIYLARVGRFTEAHDVVQSLRAKLQSVGMGRVAIWVMLLEGVIDRYENLGDRAHDRVMRAEVLSRAFSDRPLIAITSAWRAYLEFERSDFEATAEAIGRCFESASPADDDALTRATMILSYAFSMCGERALSQYWFQRCRTHALSAGDQAALEALMHNRAAFGLAWSRVERCFGRLEPASIKLARLEIESAKNFQTLIDQQSLTSLTELCVARALALEERFEEASDAFQRLKGRRPFASHNYSDGMIALEAAHCLAKLGRIEAARQELIGVHDLEFVGLDADDRLVAAWLASELAKIDDSIVPSAAGTQSRLSARVEAFGESQQRLRSALERFAPTAA